MTPLYAARCLDVYVVELYPYELWPSQPEGVIQSDLYFFRNLSALVGLAVGNDISCDQRIRGFPLEVDFRSKSY